MSSSSSSSSSSVPPPPASSSSLSPERVQSLDDLLTDDDDDASYDPSVFTARLARELDKWLPIPDVAMIVVSYVLPPGAALLVLEDGSQQVLPAMHAQACGIIRDLFHDVPVAVSARPYVVRRFVEVLGLLLRGDVTVPTPAEVGRMSPVLMNESAKALHGLVLLSNYLRCDEMLHLACAETARRMRGQPVERLGEILGGRSDDEGDGDEEEKDGDGDDEVIMGLDED